MTTIKNLLDQYNVDDVIRSCEACELRQGCNSPLPPFSSWKNITLMVVVDRPSKDEDNCSWGFGDRHNNYLKDIINKIFDSETVHYTYLTKCYSPGTVLLGKKNTKTCLDFYLSREIYQLRPKIILGMGKTTNKILDKNYEIGTYSFEGILGIDKKEYCPAVAAWESPFSLLNSGKLKTENFISLLKELKEGI